MSNYCVNQEEGANDVYETSQERISVENVRNYHFSD